MRKEELTNLGLTEEQADSVLAMAGKDIEKQKKRITDLETERDGLKERLSTAEDTLTKFEGIDPAAIKDEVEKYKQAAADAENSFKAKLLERDQKDWIGKKLDEYGVKSPYARRQLISDAMDPEKGLKWKDNEFSDFDKFMTAARELDAGLYVTAEEKKAAEEGGQGSKPAPKFVGGAGNNGGTEKKYVPPKIF